MPVCSWAACNTRWQPLSTPPTLWAWVGVGMGWGAGAMFGYDSLWRYNARTRLCAPPTTTAASWGDRRSAALAASLARAASNAPRHALLRPHGEPPAAAECRPMAASSTPQPRRERPRADRRHRPPRPPPGAIRGSSRISGAHCVECAAARSAVTAQRATSRGRASARCTSCHAHPRPRPAISPAAHLSPVCNPCTRSCCCGCSKWGRVRPGRAPLRSLHC